MESQSTELKERIQAHGRVTDTADSSLHNPEPGRTKLVPTLADAKMDTYHLDRCPMKGSMFAYAALVMRQDQDISTGHSSTA